MCSLTESEKASGEVNDTSCYFGNKLRESISDLQNQLQELCKQGMQKMSKGGEKDDFSAVIVGNDSRNDRLQCGSMRFCLVKYTAFFLS